MNTLKPGNFSFGTKSSHKNEPSNLDYGSSGCCFTDEEKDKMIEDDITEVMNMDIESIDHELNQSGVDVDAFIQKMHCKTSPNVVSLEQDTRELNEQFDELVYASYFLKKSIRKILEIDPSATLLTELETHRVNTTKDKVVSLHEERLRRQHDKEQNEHRLSKSRYWFSGLGMSAAAVASVAFYLGFLSAPSTNLLSTDEIAETQRQEKILVVEGETRLPLQKKDRNLVKTAYTEEKPQTRATVNAYMEELPPETQKSELAQVVMDQIIARVEVGGKIEATEETVKLLRVLDAEIKKSEPLPTAISKKKECESRNNVLTHIVTKNESIVRVVSDCNYNSGDLSKVDLPKVDPDDVIQYELNSHDQIRKVVVYKKNKFYIIGSQDESFVKEEKIDTYSEMLTGTTRGNLYHDLINHDYLIARPKLQDSVRKKLKSDYATILRSKNIKADMNYFLGIKYHKSNHLELVNLSLFIDKYTK